MGFAASFDESNFVLGKPPEMTHEQCDPLSVLKAETADKHPVVISCWKLTQEELDEVVRTGRVWLMIYGVTMPPSYVSGMKPFGPADCGSSE